MENKKYEFTGETKEINGRTLHRIRRLSDGVIGGWIESEANLSHEGGCWVEGEAKVYGEALVSGGAHVYGEALVYGKAWVFGEAWVYGQARVYGGALVYGGARVYGRAHVYGWARVYGEAAVSGGARVYGEAVISGNAKITKLHDIICFSGFEFKVTITPQNATIGCQTKSHEEWLAVTKEEAIKLGVPEEEYDRLRKLLLITTMVAVSCLIE